MSGRIMLVEERLESAEALWKSAVSCGFHLEIGFDLDAAITMLENGPLPDALILACGKHKLGRRSALKALRFSIRTQRLPVIVIAPAGDEEDCIRTLAAGADDYVTTPFSPAELFARVKAILRPRPVSAPDPVLVFDGLSLDPNTHSIFLMDYDKRTDLGMTPTEFKLLRLLIKHADEVLSRETIVKSVWDEERAVMPRMIDVQVYNIRAILRQVGREHMIETVPRMGYRIRSRSAL
ncbi:winged helix-turn-helix domain-containing protein [Paraburkholderia sp. DGU8]|uniref:winged helix-turn-helix domain-containing protein n=1 Tax=Paraburkholderia sp. DGU8 TaxID=3161997 RepID=UPI003465F98B